MLWSLLPCLSRAAGILAIFFLTLALPQWVLSRRYAQSIFSPDETPARPVAIVFGAGLRRDGTPTTVLADRVAVAARLFHASKVDRILMSGASQTARGNEPMAMRRLAIELGVPPDAILTDTAGHRTLDTCLRGRSRFAVSQAILVTQRFHLPRALATCSAIGLDAIGVPADLHPYHAGSQMLWRLRELPATWVALIETRGFRSIPSNPPAALGPETHDES